MRSLVVLMLTGGCAPGLEDVALDHVPDLVATPGALSLADGQVGETCIENVGDDEVIVLEVELVRVAEVRGLALPVTLGARDRVCVDVVGAGEASGWFTIRAEAPGLEVLRPGEDWAKLDRWLNVGVSADGSSVDGGLLWFGGQHQRRYEGESEALVVLSDVVSASRCEWDTASGTEGRDFAAASGLSTWTYDLDLEAYEVSYGADVLSAYLVCDFGGGRDDWAYTTLWYYGWDGLRRAE